MPRIGEQRVGVVGDEGACPIAPRRRARPRRKRRPASRTRQLRAGARGVEVGDGDDVHAGGGARLGEEHRAELAGADDADGHRPPLRLPLEQHLVKVQGRGPFEFRADRITGASGAQAGH